jgi:hypothetical protein
MFPNYDDRANYKVHIDSLLPTWGVVTADEITQQVHRDANNRPCLLVVKNGGATGTTIGRANGLVSVKRTFAEYGIVEQDSLEIAIISYGKDRPYGKHHGRFSDKGDSGAIVLTRDGNILGMLNSRRGSTEETDVTYVTPFWWLLQRIKAKYPNAHLYLVRTGQN